MYQQALGDAYAQLPLAVQRFHRLSGRIVLHGQVQTHAPRSMLANALALCLGTPRHAGSGPIRFELTAASTEETWTRHFPTRTMTSRMRLVATHVEEHLGAARLRFKLLASTDRLSMQLVGMWFWGIRCPSWLLLRIVAEESGAEEQLHFFITADLPWIGRVAGYQGHLEIGRRELA